MRLQRGRDARRFSGLHLFFQIRKEQILLDGRIERFLAFGDGLFQQFGKVGVCIGIVGQLHIYGAGQAAGDGGGFGAGLGPRSTGGIALAQIIDAIDSLRLLYGDPCYMPVQAMHGCWPHRLIVHGFWARARTCFRTEA